MTAGKDMMAMLGVCCALLAWTATAHTAAAAPQIVAAVPSNGTIALSCDAEVCAAEISTVCLQRSRAAPPPGRRYAVHAPDRTAIAVTGRRTDGRDVVLDAGILDFAALRGQVAFRVALRKRDLERLGLAGAAIRVERLAMLVPVPETGDATPQTAAEVARASGEMAATGGYWLVLEEETMAVARVANRIINRLPESGSIAASQAQSLWRKALAPEDGLAQGGHQDAVARARHMVEYCRASAFERGQFPMRRCLARFHDRAMQDLNRDYWDTLKPQS